MKRFRQLWKACTGKTKELPKAASETRLLLGVLIHSNKAVFQEVPGVVGAVRDSDDLRWSAKRRAASGG